MSPYLSIITPVYNGEPFVKRCYWSLSRQTVDDWEWVVIDDGSNDNTSALLHELAMRDSRIRCFRSPSNRGIGCARTWALLEARAPWIVVSDIDDFNFPWRLERITDAIEKGYDFACSFVVVADPTMRILGVRDFEKSLYRFTHPSLACRTDLARKIGYSPNLRTVNQIGEDKRLILTLAARHWGYYHRAPLVIYQPSVGSLLRSIHSNLVGLYSVSQLFHDGTLALSQLSYLRTQFRDCAKIAVLNLLRVKPGIYHRIMQRRRLGPPAKDYQLTPSELEFIKQYVSMSWDMSRSPAVDNDFGASVNLDSRLTTADQIQIRRVA